MYLCSQGVFGWFSCFKTMYKAKRVTSNAQSCDGKVQVKIAMPSSDNSLRRGKQHARAESCSKHFSHLIWSCCNCQTCHSISQSSHGWTLPDYVGLESHWIYSSRHNAGLPHLLQLPGDVVIDPAHADSGETTIKSTVSAQKDTLTTITTSAT